MFINDLPLYTDNVYTDLYADDTTIFQISNSQHVIEENLQLALRKLSVWCKLNGMLLNTEKTKVMLITSLQKRLHLHDNILNLTFNNDTLKNVDNDKVLGVHIDTNLTWPIHIQFIVRKFLQICDFYQNWKSIYPLSIEYNFIKHTFNPTLITVPQYGENISFQPRQNLQITKAGC